VPGARGPFLDCGCQVSSGTVGERGGGVAFAPSGVVSKFDW